MSADAAVRQAGFSRAEILLTLLGLMLGLFLAGLDQTIVATALPVIARDLGGSQVMGWIITSYLVALTTATPIYGRLSDLYGRRPVVLVSVGAFVAASVLCALSRSLPELVAARVLQGIGGGGLRSMALVVMADLVPPRQRGRYQGYFAGTMTTASALGPILGGTLAQNLSWRWIFWVNLPIGLAAYLLSKRNLARLGLPSKRATVDWLGAVLIAASATLILIGIGKFGAAQPDARVWALLFVGAGLACGTALIRWEWVATQPILPLALFRNPVFVSGIAVISLMSAFIAGLIVAIPLHYQLATGLSPQEAGLRMIPLTSGTAVGSLLAGQLVSWTGRYRLFPAVGAGTAGVASIAIAQTGLGFSLPFDVVMTGVLGVAAGFQISPISVAVQNALRRDEMGIGMASLLLVRSLAGAVGVALVGVLLIGSVDGALTGPPYDGIQHYAVLSPSHESAAAPAESSVIATETLRRGLSRVFLINAAIMAAALCASLTMQERPLGDEHQ